MNIRLILTGMALCLLFVITACGYKSKYKKDWGEVEEHIRNNWDKYTGTNPILPHPFTYAIEKSHFYYWDIYFMDKGLIRHGKWNLIKNNLDNYIFEIDTFGFIPNATEWWGYNRSQIPFFSMMVRDYYEAVPDKDKQWLGKAYQACLKEYKFWTDTSSSAIENHKTTIPGLIRFYHHATYKEVSTLYDNVGVNNRFSNDTTIKSIEQKIDFGANFIAECEGSMDFTPRFQQHIINYIPVCLNSNIYQYEKNFPWFEKELGLPASANWDSLAECRKKLIVQYCWDNSRKIFTDYDFVNKRLNPVMSYAMFYPLLYGIASAEQAEGIVKNLPVLETEFGIIAVEKTINKHPYQWDHRSIWPPVQWVAYTALKNYKYVKEANRIACKYLDVVTKNYINPIPSVYTKDGKTKTRPVHLTWEKYTPDGCLNDADYPCNEMLGWTGGVFVELYMSVK